MHKILYAVHHMYETVSGFFMRLFSIFFFKYLCFGFRDAIDICILITNSVMYHTDMTNSVMHHTDML